MVKWQLFTPQTNYDKAVILILTLVVAVLGPILASNLDLGIPRIALNWLSVLVSAAGGAIAIIQQNKNQPTIPRYHAIADMADIRPGAPLIAEHKD